MINRCYDLEGCTVTGAAFFVPGIKMLYIFQLVFLKIIYNYIWIF